MDILLSTVLIGIGATAATDLWALLRHRLFAVPPPNYGLVGRWIGHMPQGRFVHDSIAAATPVSGERLLGWSVHYLIGVVFAAILIALFGAGWLQQPALLPALLVGIATVAAPYLLLQPGMGAGLAARRTPHPNKARLHSLIMHAVFGLGLYGSGLLLRALLAF